MKRRQFLQSVVALAILPSVFITKKRNGWYAYREESCLLEPVRLGRIKPYHDAKVLLNIPKPVLPNRYDPYISPEAYEDMKDWGYE